MGSTLVSSSFQGPDCSGSFIVGGILALTVGWERPFNNAVVGERGILRDPQQIAFYKTKAWKQCRAGYFKAHSLCEECLREGLITPGEFVHHKIHVSMQTIQEPAVLLNWDNLETLCRKHHAEIHSGVKKRFEIDEFGRVSAL